MKRNRREILIGGSMILFMAATTWWSYGVMTSARHGAQVAAEDLADCERLSESIKRLSALPTQAIADKVATATIAARLESAAQEAGVSPESIVRTSPQPSRRLGDSPYSEQPTRIDVRSVTLRQLVTLLHGLAAEDDNLRVRDMRITAPRSDERDNVWDAEFTIAHLIYNPQDPAATR